MQTKTVRSVESLFTWKQPLFCNATRAHTHINYEFTCHWLWNETCSTTPGVFGASSKTIGRQETWCPWNQLKIKAKNTTGFFKKKNWRILVIIFCDQKIFNQEYFVLCVGKSIYCRSHKCKKLCMVFFLCRFYAALLLDLLYVVHAHRELTPPSPPPFPENQIKALLRP